MLLQIKNSTCKLEIVLQIKNEKSCVRSMSDDDLCDLALQQSDHSCFMFVIFLVCMYNF